MSEIIHLQERLDGLYWSNNLGHIAEAGKFIDNFGEPVSMTVELHGINHPYPDGSVGDWVGVPRTWAPIYVENDRREEGAPIAVTAPPKARNEKQAKILAELKEAIWSDVYTGQIVAPTGFGKTWIGCQVIGMVPRTALIVTTKRDEMENWKKHCKEFLGIEAEEWHGDVVPSMDAKIVVGLVQSIAKGPERYSKELYEQFGLVIFDECHRLGADFFVQSCMHLPALWRYGMSATPKRADGRERVIKAHLGPVIAEAEGVPMVPKVYVIPSGFQLPVWKNKTVEPKVGKLSWVDKKLRADHMRNAKILAIIHKCYKEGRNTVIFSNVKAHLEELAKACTVPNEAIGFYIGGKTIEELERAAALPTVFATYQMGGQGTNYPWWDAVILTTPLSNVKQPIGRILREYPDKKTPVIFDITDPGKIWGNYFKKRMAVYHEYGAAVATVNV